MVKKIKLREEIDGKYQWDLSKIYGSQKEIDADILRVKEFTKEMASYQGKLASDANTLYNATTMYFRIMRIIDKLVVYSNMKFHEDMSNSESQILVGKISKLSDDISEELAFYSPELLKEDYSKILAFEKEFKELEKYHFTFEDLFREKKHILPLNQEQMMARLGEVFSASSDTYEMLNDVDITFGMIHDEEGKEVELTESNYSKYMKSSNRNVRKDAFTTLYKSYGNLKNTFASTFKGSIKADTFISKIRNYENTLSMSLYSDNISVQLYENLISKVSDRLDIVYDYMKLRKEVLGLDELHMYDIYAPLVSNNDKVYTYEEAKELVINALSFLGEDYIKNLKLLFDSSCIDVFHNKNKRGGAYSWGSYDTLPYVLLNFEGTFNDVSTIAHELGHAMHSYYSHNAREYHDANYTIFLAEIASTVNEILLNRYCYLHATDVSEKLFYLNNLLENFRTTLIRQTMFAEFEKIVHEKDEAGEVLTEEEITNIYYELNKKYYGEEIVHDKEIGLEWMRITHFYNSFYVYKYATGIAVAAKIALAILNGEENALENYLEFLKSGGKTYSLDILKGVGIDIVHDDTIDKALDSFESTLKEFREIL